MGIPRELQARLESYGIQADGSASTQEAETVSLTGETAQAEPSAKMQEDQTLSTEELASEDAAIAGVSDSTLSVEDAQTSAPSDAQDANYKRMEGRYKAQVKRLEEQLADLKDQARGASGLVDMLAATREELATLRAQKEPTPQPTVPEVPELTAEELEMFGDFAPVADKLIAKATAPLLKEIAELKTRTGEVDERIGKTSEAMFISNVRAKVANFDQAITHPEWQAYLNRPVPFTSLKLGEALGQAHHARDLDRVAEIFNAFTQQQLQPSSAVTSMPTQVVNPSMQPTQGAAPKNNLAQFATPDRTAVNPTGKALPRYRESDYSAKLHELRAGRITKEQFQQFDKDFFEAKRQGLVA
jgi:hypothetical protein